MHLFFRAIAMILLLSFSTASTAKILENIDWPKEVWSKQFPALSCGFDAVIICDKDRPFCSTIHEFDIGNIGAEIDLKNLTYSEGTTNKLLIEGSSIGETGFSGYIRARAGNSGVAIMFFRPSDPNGKITMARTSDSEGKSRQTMYGKCYLAR